MNTKLDTLPADLAALYVAQPDAQQHVPKGNVRDFASVMQDFTPIEPSLKSSSSLQQPAPSSKPKVSFTQATTKTQDTEVRDTPKAEVEAPDAQELQATEDIESETISTEVDFAPVAAAEVSDDVEIDTTAPEPIATVIKPEVTISKEDLEVEAQVELDSKDDEGIQLEETYEREQEFEAPQAVHIDTKVEVSDKAETDIEVVETADLETEAVDVRSEDVVIRKDVDAPKNPEPKSESKPEVTDEAPYIEGKKEAIIEAAPSIKEVKSDTLITKEELELQKLEIEAKIYTDKAEQDKTSAVVVAPSVSKEGTAPIEDTNDKKVEPSIIVKTPEVETQNSNTDLMKEGDAEHDAQLMGSKIELQLEDNKQEIRTIFANEAPPTKDAPSISSKDVTAETPRQVFKQVAEHIKSLVTNHNNASGESVTTINLQPGNLGHVSVQIVTKGNETHIKLIAAKEATFEIMQKGWDTFVKENLETVSSNSDASLSFSLEKGNQDSQNPQNMYDFFREMSESSSDQKQVAPAGKSVYDVARSATISIYKPEAGEVDLAL